MGGHVGRPLSLAESRTIEVAILASRVRLDYAAQVRAFLSERAVSVRDFDGSPGVSVVVLVDESLLRDPLIQPALAGLDELRVIPLRIGPVEAGRLPEPLREINWIDVDGPDPWTDLLRAIRSKPERVRRARDLEARARAWHAAGRHGDRLLDDPDEIGEAQAHVAEARKDPIAFPTPLAVEYVELSARTSTRARRRAWRRRLSIAAVVIVAAVAVTIAVTTLRSAGQVNRLTFRVTGLYLDEGHPDWGALVSAGLLAQGGEDVAGLARSTLYRQLSLKGDVGAIGGLNGAAPIDAVPIDGGRALVVVDAGNNVSSWDIATGTLQWRRSLGFGIPRWIDALPDGSSVAVVDYDAVHLVHPLPWQRETIHLPPNQSRVDLLGLGEMVVTDGDGTVTLLREAAGALVVGGSSHHSQVLDIRRLPEGGGHALVSDGPRITMIDVESGRALHSTSLPDDPTFRSGAVGPDGESAAITRPDHTIWLAGGDLAFRPTGQAVADNDHLAVLAGGRVAFGGVPFGVQVLDPPSGLVLGRMCGSLHGITHLRAAADTDTVVCGNDTGVLVSDDRALDLPRPPEPNVALGTTPRTDAAGVHVEGDANGGVQVSNAHGSGHAAPLVDAVTAVAVRDDGGAVVVGSVSGQVAELEFTPTGADVVATWSAPGRAAVRGIGWSRDRPGSLVVHDAADRWWAPRACDGCTSNARLFDEVRARLFPCYLPQQLDDLTDGTRERLGVRECVKSPDPEAG